MAGRIRSLKPELREHAAFAMLTDGAARLFLMLYTLADDEGRCPAGARFLAGAVFFGRPRSAPVVGRLLAELESASLVALYDGDGAPHLEIVGWRDRGTVTHQRIEKPQPARYPAPGPSHSGKVFPERSVTDLRPPTKTTTTDRDQERDQELSLSLSAPTHCTATSSPKVSKSSGTSVVIAKFCDRFRIKHGHAYTLTPKARRKREEELRPLVAEHGEAEALRRIDLLFDHSWWFAKSATTLETFVAHWNELVQAPGTRSGAPSNGARVGRAEPASADQHAADAARGATPWL